MINLSFWVVLAPVLAAFCTSSSSLYYYLLHTHRQARLIGGNSMLQTEIYSADDLKVVWCLYLFARRISASFNKINAKRAHNRLICSEALQRALLSTLLRWNGKGVQETLKECEGASYLCTLLLTPKGQNDAPAPTSRNTATYSILTFLTRNWDRKSLDIAVETSVFPLFERVHR